MKKPISNLQYKRFKEGDRFKRFGETWFTFAPNGEPNCLFFAAQIHNDHFCKPWVCPRLQSNMMTYVKSPGAGANNVLAARAKNIVIRPRDQRCNKHRLVIAPCSSLHLQPPSTVTTWVQLTPNRQKLDRDVEAPAKMNGRMCKTEHNY